MLYKIVSFEPKRKEETKHARQISEVKNPLKMLTCLLFLLIMSSFLFVFVSFVSFLNLRMLLWAFGLRNSGGRVTKYSMLTMRDFTMPVVNQAIFLHIIRIRGWYYVCGRNCRKSTNQTAASDRAAILNFANWLVSIIFLQIQLFQIWLCLFIGGTILLFM